MNRSCSKPPCLAREQEPILAASVLLAEQVLVRGAACALYEIFPPIPAQTRVYTMQVNPYNAFHKLSLILLASAFLSLNASCV